MTIVLSLLLCLFGCTSASAEMGPPIPDDKKIIGFAGIVMSPAYLREHIADVERIPFDGLTFTVYGNDWKHRKTGQEHLFFGGHRYKPGDFSNDLADLKATKFKRFTDNFILVQTSARGSVVTGNPKDGNLDWFDPAWDGVAWDWLQFDPDLESLARRCEAVCFGSLAQRTGQSRNTIYRFLEAAGRAIKLFDVNLRQQYYNRNVLDRSCKLATGVKLNQQELAVVCETLAVTSDQEATPGATPGAGSGRDDQLAQRLLKKYRLRFIALTRGKDGTVIYTAGDRVEGKRVAYHPADNADSVGAGDACSAAILVGLVLRMDMSKTVDLANHVGAYVASQPGGTPELPQAILDMVKG